MELRTLAIIGVLIALAGSILLTFSHKDSTLRSVGVFLNTSGLSCAATFLYWMG